MPLADHTRTAPAPRAIAGFTLVELLMSMLTSSILALLAGAFLVSVAQAFRSSNAEIGMQRDGAAALQMIRYKVRAASQSRVSVSPGLVEVEDVDGTRISFGRVGSDLVFDADADEDGGELTIVRGRIQDFTATNSPLRLDLALELTDSGETHRLTTSICYRNNP